MTIIIGVLFAIVLVMMYDNGKDKKEMRKQIKEMREQINLVQTQINVVTDQQ